MSRFHANGPIINLLKLKPWKNRLRVSAALICTKLVYKLQNRLVNGRSLYSV